MEYLNVGVPQITCQFKDKPFTHIGTGNAISTESE